MKEQKNRCVFYLIDGARPDILSRLIDEGHLPNIQKHMIEEGSFVKGTTCFPSTTGPAYLPFLTGKFPGDHDITGIRWFDKEQYFKGRWNRNSMRSYCGYEAKYFNDDMNPDYPSLFERYSESYNIYNMVTKGVPEDHDLTKEGKSKLYFDAHFKHIHHLVDEKGHAKLMSAAEKDFTFIFAVFPSIDWDSHTYHFEDEKTIEAYKLVDRSLGEFIQKLKVENKYDETLIVMASDHGLTSTHTHLDLGKFFRKNGYRVLEYPTIASIFPKVAVFISGNSFATLTFLDRKELYNSEELMNKHGQVINKLLRDPAIDFIVMRKDDQCISVINEDGEAHILLENGKMKYVPVSANPFKLEDSNNFMDEAEAFDFTFNSDY
ncbi:MAG: alkaline phosphatase family protein, partial [Bacteroidia bacterium]|nr:alkaline phosphatase family protein [Bacteroidia bacterium]